MTKTKFRFMNMNERSLQIKRTVAYSILVFVNLLFAWKYLSRQTEMAAFLVVLLPVFYLLLWKIRFKFSPGSRLITTSLVIISLVFVASSVLVFRLFPVENLLVDRWSVITSFWESFSSGGYVYHARSNMGNPPGAMPFYFILALPFYLAGELGGLSILGLFVFLFIMLRSSISRQDILWIILFLLTSFYFLYEIPTRSNIFFNASLFLGLMVWLNFTGKKKLSRGIILSAIMTGMILSTRFILAIPLIVLFIWFLRTRQMTLQDISKYGLIALSAFIVTFIPFMAGHFQDFLRINPFLLQTSLFIPSYYTLGFLALAFLLSFFCRNEADVYFFSGISLFMSILIYFIYHAVLNGFQEAYIKSIVDISYFIFAAPFLLYYLVSDRNTEQYRFSQA